MISFVHTWVLHIPLFHIFHVALLSGFVPIFVTAIPQISVHLLWMLLSVTCSKESGIRSLWLVIIFTLINFIWTVWSTLKFEDDKNNKYDSYHSSCYDTNYESCFLSCLRGDVFIIFASRWSWCKGDYHRGQWYFCAGGGSATGACAATCCWWRSAANVVWCAVATCRWGWGTWTSTDTTAGH